MKKLYCVTFGKYRKFENLKYHTSEKKTLVFSIISRILIRRYRWNKKYLVREINWN